MTRSGEDCVHTLIGAYVLDAVTDMERRAVQDHLVECDTCAAEAEELRATAARLGDAAVTTPPAGLREKVLAEVSRTRQDGPPNRRTESASRADPRRWAVAAAAVLILIMVAVGVTYGVQQSRLNDQRQRLAAATAQQNRMSAVLAAPDATVTANRSLTGGGRARMIVSRQLDRGVVVLAGLPAPRSGRVYELWLMKGSELSGAVPVRVLEPGQRATTALMSGVVGHDTFGISVEPPGGSDHPSPRSVYGALPLPA